MTSIPCEKNAELKDKIEEFAEVLRVETHTLGAHGLSEREAITSRAGTKRLCIQRSSESNSHIGANARFK